MELTPIKIGYDARSSQGILERGTDLPNGVWIRMRTSAKSADNECLITENKIRLDWSALLNLIREFSSLQKTLGFKFEPNDTSREKIRTFIEEFKQVAKGRDQISLKLTEDQIDPMLAEQGWDITKRKLKSYQKTNLVRLISLSHGANFSVPGAGKTTVTFALHLLLKTPGSCLLVVAPKNAFPAWKEIIDECMYENSNITEPFTILTGGAENIELTLQNKAARLLISYDQLTRVEPLIANYLARNKVHLVLDESHRMKAGYGSLRGSTLLNISHLASRRDILTGTPMPQSATDMQSQIDFLWPGMGFGTRISQGEPPRQIISNLYVRTTKKDLGLPKRTTHFIPVQMADAHKALYCVIRDEVRRQVSNIRLKKNFDIIKARKSVIRLLQVSTNPLVAIEKMGGYGANNLPAIVEAVIQEGPSSKIRKACEMARNFATQGEKVIIWTIFTDTINRINNLLADLNPVVIYGQTPSGDIEDEDTRESILERFKHDPQCHVLVANPAAASEGISLHMQCHNAIYLDRSYNATHYLQSIDRIHRLGLPPNIETHVWILQNLVPSGIGSIDHSVSRRLAKKIRGMEKLLEDPDLNQLAMDEENAPIPIEEGIDLQDIDDLIKEIEGHDEDIDDELA